VSWSAVGRTIEPDPAWVRAADERYQRFSELGTGASSARAAASARAAWSGTGGQRVHRCGAFRDRRGCREAPVTAQIP
jgi:hypothetical protein